MGNCRPSPEGGFQPGGFPGIGGEILGGQGLCGADLPCLILGWTPNLGPSVSPKLETDLYDAKDIFFKGILSRTIMSRMTGVK